MPGRTGENGRRGPCGWGEVRRKRSRIEREDPVGAAKARTRARSCRNGPLYVTNGSMHVGSVRNEMGTGRRWRLSVHFKRVTADKAAVGGQQTFQWWRSRYNEELASVCSLRSCALPEGRSRGSACASKHPFRQYLFVLKTGSKVLVQVNEPLCIKAQPCCRNSK